MREEEKILWDVVDEAIFKTTDPEAIREKAKRSGAAWLKERNTFGGALKQLIRSRRLTSLECALKCGVARSAWQSWESGRTAPTEAEFQNLCQHLDLGHRNEKRFRSLLQKFPKQRLLIFSRLKPENLAARGVAKIEDDIEWQKLPDEVRLPLGQWAQTQGMESLRELFDYLGALEDERAREAWAKEIFEGCNDAE